MSSEIVSIDQHGLPLSDPELLREIRRASKAPETWRAIVKNWKAFIIWCDGAGSSPLPCSPQAMESYLIHLVGKGMRTATIEQARYSIDAWHKWAGFVPPGDSELVKTTMAGIRRKLRARPDRKRALTIDHLRQVGFPKTLTGMRDKAILLIGFAGGFRRSELAAIQVEHLEEIPSGLVVNLPRSKSDQEGKGESVSIVRSASSPEWCPVQALHHWLEAAEIDSGAVFRSISKGGKVGKQLSEKWVYLLVKQVAKTCGWDPSQFGGHSLRSGCATYLLERGVPLNIVSQHLRHKRVDTTLKYDRSATAKALMGVY